MDPAALRPLRVGEILDVAIKVYRAHFATLAKAVLVVVAPVQVLAALVQLSAGDESLDTFDPESPQFGEADPGPLLGFIAAVAAIGLIGFVATQLATAASLRVVSGAYLGEALSWQESLRFAVSRLRSLLWLAIVYAFLLTLAVLALLVPGVYFYFAWAVAVPALLLEDVRGRAALKRSRQLVRGRWGPTFLAVVLGILLASIVQGVIQGLLAGVVAAGVDDDLALAVAQAVAGIASSAIVTPFTAAVTIVVYFDLRVRKEGFDLELLARGVGVEPPADLPGPPGAEPLPQGDDGEAPPYWPPPPGWRPRG